MDTPINFRSISGKYMILHCAYSRSTRGPSLTYLIMTVSQSMMLGRILMIDGCISAHGRFCHHTTAFPLLERNAI
jgi:hypothetical protein